MRTRLTRAQRRNSILEKARTLFAERGLAGTEMEDIRLSCGISRGGLYHHFASKRAILDALVENDVTKLADTLAKTDLPPIVALLQAGSSHLGNAPGTVFGLHTTEERLDYLSALEQAVSNLLSDLLRDRLTGHVRPGTDPGHVAELFLTVNAHINRRAVLGQWTSAEAADFAATALTALAPLLSNPSDLEPTISALKEQASAS